MSDVPQWPVMRSRSSLHHHPAEPLASRYSTHLSRHAETVPVLKEGRSLARVPDRMAASSRHALSRLACRHFWSGSSVLRQQLHSVLYAVGRFGKGVLEGPASAWWTEFSAVFHKTEVSGFHRLGRDAAKDHSYPTTVATLPKSTPPGRSWMDPPPSALRLCRRFPSRLGFRSVAFPSLSGLVIAAMPASRSGKS